MSNGPQLKSRRSLQPTDNKLARLEAVSNWTEEPAQDQAQVIKKEDEALKSSVRVAEPSEVLTPGPVRENARKSRSWTGKSKKVVVATQMSFRLPLALKERMEDALYRLNDGTNMTDLIVQGLEAEVAAIEAFLAGEK